MELLTQVNIKIEGIEHRLTQSLPRNNNQKFYMYYKI